MVDKDILVVYDEMVIVIYSKFLEEKGLLYYYVNIVMDQDKVIEEQDMVFLGELNVIIVIFDIKFLEDKGLLFYFVDIVMEQDKIVEEYVIIFLGEQKEFLVNFDIKVFEENNDKIDEGEVNNMNLGDDGSRSVDYD